jgi:hypothetical protein
MFFDQLLREQILKAQKDSQVVSLFTLLGSASAKAASRTLMKLTPVAQLCSSSTTTPYIMKAFF